MYVKCEYARGPFSDEYFVRFKDTKPDIWNWTFVNIVQVSKQTETTGLLKILGAKREPGGRIVISLNCCEGLKWFTVSREELVEKL